MLAMRLIALPASHTGYTNACNILPVLAKLPVRLLTAKPLERKNEFIQTMDAKNNWIFYMKTESRAFLWTADCLLSPLYAPQRYCPAGCVAG